MDWDEFTADIEKAVSARLDTLQSNIDSHHQTLKSTISKLNSFTQLLQEKLPGGLFPISEVKKTPKLLSPSIETPKSNRASSRDTKSFQIDHKEPSTKSEDSKKRLEDAKKKKEEEDQRKKDLLAKKKEEDDKKREENKRKMEEAKEKKKHEEAEKKHKIEEEKERKKQEDAEKKLKVEGDKKAAEEQKAKKKQAEEEKKRKTQEIQRKSSEEPRRNTHNAGEEKKVETNKSKIGQPRGLKPPSTIPKPNSKLAAQKSPLRTPPKPDSPAPPELPAARHPDPPQAPQKEPELELLIEESLTTQETLQEKPPEPLKSLKTEPDKPETPKLPDSPTETPNKIPESPNKKLETPIEHSSYSNRRSSFNLSDSSTEKPSSDNQSDASKLALKFQKRSSISVTLNSSSDDLSNSSFIYRQNTDPAILVESLTRSVIPPQITLDEISTQLQLFEGHYSQSDLNTEKKFDLSVGAKSALSLLTTMDEDKFHLNHVPREEVIWSFRLFFRLIGKDLNENPELAWTECQEFLKNARDRELNKKSVDKVVLDVISNFDFSDENIDKVEEMIADKEQFLQPQYYTEMCPITGLFMFAIREASIYAGVIKGKIPVWRQYRRLLHKRQRMLVN